MSILIHLDDLVKCCGYFATTKYRDGTWKNNGYGCTHRGKKGEPGKCFSFDCPVAVNADYEDMLKHDPELAKQYEAEQEENGEIESSWMLVHRPCYLKKIFPEGGEVV